TRCATTLSSSGPGCAGSWSTRRRRSSPRSRRASASTRPDSWPDGESRSAPRRRSPRSGPARSRSPAEGASRRIRSSGPREPRRFRMRGQAATLGRYKGIALVLGVPLRGFIGWFVTRTYHLYQLPLFSRKLRVVTDWTVALLFRRDIAELGMLGHPRRLGGD